MTWQPPEYGEPRQLMDAAFWEIREHPDRPGVRREPIDDHALYGSESGASLGDVDPGELDCPHRRALRDLRTALSVLSERQYQNPGDRVRINDGGWMEVVPPSEHSSLGDVVLRYEEGSVLYCVAPDEHPADGFGPKLRRCDGYTSQGTVWCVEVDWADEGAVA